MNTEIIGNRGFLDQMKDAVMNKRILGTYMIEGAMGTGKLLLARTFAAAALCSEGSDGMPCMECSSCRRIFEGIHPDVAEISPADDKSQITVDEIREMVLSAYLAPTEGDRKFYIIRPADKMNQQAQNALLKGIEEPPSGVTYLLLTEDITSQLPTVISRSYRMKTEELSMSVIEEALSKEFSQTDRDTIRFAALLSSGSLGRARSLISDGEMAEARKKALELLRIFSSETSPIKRSEALSYSLTREKLVLLLSMVNLGARDLLLAKYTDDHFLPMLYDDTAVMRSLARSFNGRSLVKLFDTTSELIKAQNRNVNSLCAVSAVNNLL